MAEGGCPGGRGCHRKRQGDGTGVGDLAAARQRLPATHVFDLWADRWRRREATGDVIIVRYADDIVVGFEHEADARALLGRDAETVRGVRAVAPYGQDPSDRVWSPCGNQTREGRARQAGDIQLP